MIKINLLGDTLAQVGGKKTEKPEATPVYAEAEGARRSGFPIAGVILGLVLASMGGVYYIYLNGKVEQAQREKVELTAKKQELEKYIQLEKTFRSRAGFSRKTVCACRCWAART